MSYSMSDLLQLVVSEGASDLHIRVGTPPTIRVHGILHRVEGPALKPEDTEELMRSITSEEHIQSTRERGGADFGFAFGDVARFRVSVFKEKGNFGMVLRQIPSKLLTMEQIGIPPSAKELLYKPRGLVLVTGPTGSRQNHHARLHDQHHQRGTRRGAHHHHRGPDRVLPQTQEGAGHPARNRRGRAEFRRRPCAARCARTRT